MNNSLWHYSEAEDLLAALKKDLYPENRQVLAAAANAHAVLALAAVQSEGNRETRGLFA
jgi:hypothetical protein